MNSCNNRLFDVSRMNSCNNRLFDVSRMKHRVRTLILIEKETGPSLGTDAGEQMAVRVEPAVARKPVLLIRRPHTDATSSPAGQHLLSRDSPYVRTMSLSRHSVHLEYS
ncbi:hypothetical protein J6590_051565 [Homalodisca vitripennis]|nr:hypothetical protein J6590_051565 [Homalodisca vitripennis]